MPVDALAAGSSPMMSASSEAHAADALRAARAAFNHTLASWASDLLLLQKRGLHVPTWDGPIGSPHAGDGMRKAA